MSENSVCFNCNKPVKEHTEIELRLCSMKIPDTAAPEVTDQQATDYFNEIKSGEFYRMMKRKDAKES